MSFNCKFTPKEISDFLESERKALKRRRLILQISTLILTALIGVAIAFYIAFALNLYKGDSNAVRITNSSCTVTTDDSPVYKGVADGM